MDNISLLGILTACFLYLVTFFLTEEFDDSDEELEEEIVSHPINSFALSKHDVKRRGTDKWHEYVVSALTCKDGRVYKNGGMNSLAKAEAAYTKACKDYQASEGFRVTLVKRDMSGTTVTSELQIDARLPEMKRRGQ